MAASNTIVLSISGLNLVTGILVSNIPFFRNIPLFEDWLEESLRALCFKGVLTSNPFGKVIEKDWSTTKRVFFVIKVSAKNYNV